MKNKTEAKKTTSTQVAYVDGETLAESQCTADGNKTGQNQYNNSGTNLELKPSTINHQPATQYQTSPTPNIDPLVFPYFSRYHPPTN